MWQSSPFVRPTKTLNKDLAPMGDDIDPMEVAPEDVEMEDDDEEEPLEQDVSRARMNDENPKRERNMNMKILDMLSTTVGVLLVSKVVEFGEQCRIELFNEEARQR